MRGQMRDPFLLLLTPQRSLKVITDRPVFFDREGGAIMKERSDILESEQPPEEGTEWVNVDGFLQQASQGIKLPLHANSSFHHDKFY